MGCYTTQPIGIIHRFSVLRATFLHHASGSSILAFTSCSPASYISRIYKEGIGEDLLKRFRYVPPSPVVLARHEHMLIPSIWRWPGRLLFLLRTTIPRQEQVQGSEAEEPQHVFVAVNNLLGSSAFFNTEPP